MKCTRQLVLAILLPAALLASACDGDDDDDDDDNDIADAAQVIDATPPEPDATPINSALCYPEGIYGICEDLGCPSCLDGAGFYKTCTSSCTDTAQCGDAADFDGATPLCAPLNPGAMQMICVLTCTMDEQCPCGLPCIPSGAGVNICAKPTT